MPIGTSRRLAPLSIALVLLACKGPESSPAPAPSASVAATQSAATSASASASSSVALSASAAKKRPSPHPIATDEGDVDAAATPAPKVKKPFEIGKFDPKAKLPGGVKLEGAMDAAMVWTDALGDNAAFATRREVKDKAGTSVYLRVQHWADGGSGWKLLREIKDQSERCEFDNVTAFRRASFAVDDADRNGVGELRFAYVVDCVSDVSPQTAKLVVLEGGAKSILRGSTLLIDGDEVYGGTFTPDPGPAKWKPKLLAGAMTAWKGTFGEAPRK
jgi:hypothetical protein